MAYGRLEVYYPDGAFKTFLLNDPNVSIGRSAGNMIPLDVEGISRYHVSLSYTEGNIRITDLESANGTFVDGERLKPNQPTPLLGGEEIQIGELRLVFQSFDETPTRPVMIPPEEATRRVELEPGKFTVDLFEPDQPVSPGAHISAQLTISNTGDKPERFTVEVGGLPADWVRIDRRELEIAPGKGGDVVINFKPRRRPDSAPGDYAVTAIVRAASSPTAEVRTHFILRVLAYGGFGMAVEQRQFRTGESYRLHLHNQGSAPLPLVVMPRDMSNSLNIAVSQPRLTLNAGQRALITGQVRAKNPLLFGDARRFSFDLVVRSGDAAGFTAATRLYATEKPPFPSWARFAALGVVLTLIGLIAVGIILLLIPPADPRLEAFSVSSDSVQQGQPISIAWVARNAQQVEVYANGMLMGTYASDTTGTQIDTTALNGAVSVEVRAVNNGGRSDSRSQTVNVAPAFQIAAFNADPPTISRYTLQTLTLTWDIPGAESAVISGLEGFTTAPIDTGNQPSGTITVQGIWQSPLPMMLNVSARSGTGETIQSTLTVNTVPVTCAPQSGDVALYGAPDGRGQVVATVPLGTDVDITGRDLGNAWLRVSLSGGASGWGRRESFACPADFAIENLLLVADVATALPDVTGSPTPAQSQQQAPPTTPVPLMQLTPAAPAATPTINFTG